MTEIATHPFGLEADAGAHDRLFHKAAMRLAPFLSIFYLGAYLDRVNVGFAELQMHRDLGFSETVYGLRAGMFFVGYVPFTAILMASILGGPLSESIFSVVSDAHGFEGWRWLFMIEAMPSLVLAVAILLHLDDRIETAKGLDADEKRTLLAAADASPAQASFSTLPSAFLRGAAAAGIALVNSLRNVSVFASAYFVGWLAELTYSNASSLYLFGASSCRGPSSSCRFPLARSTHRPARQSALQRLKKGR